MRKPSFDEQQLTPREALLRHALTGNSSADHPKKTGSISWISPGSSSRVVPYLDVSEVSASGGNPETIAARTGQPLAETEQRLRAVFADQLISDGGAQQSLTSENGVQQRDTSELGIAARISSVASSILGKSPSSNFNHIVAQSATQGVFLDKGMYILNPNHKYFHRWWNLTVVLTYWNLFQVPFTTSFESSKGRVVDVLIWIVDMLFVVDIAVVFNTPIYPNGQLCVGRWEIAKQYLRLHFWIDIFAAVPIDRIFAEIFPTSKYVTLLSFTRVLRIRRLYVLLNKMEKDINMNYEVVVLLKLLSLIMVLCHLEACLFWYIGFVQPTGWMYVTDTVDDLEDDWGNYLISLYWAVTTYTTVGYGDISPTNKAERSYTIIVMILNMALTAYVLGNITMLTTKSDQSVLEYRAIVTEVKNYLHRRGIEAEMQDVAIQHLSTKREMAEETDQALEHCAPHIRNRILSILYRDKLSSSRVLNGGSSDFLNYMAHSATMEFFQTDTTILQPKERSLCLYYVLSGVLSLFGADQEELRMIGPGTTFGDEGVFCEFAQYYSVKAKTLVKVLVIHIDSIKRICDEYKQDHRVVCMNLAKRLEKYKPKNELEATDIKESITRIKSHVASLKTDLVTKLCYFAGSGDIPGVKILMHSDKEHDINEGDYDGRRPLHVAAASGNVKMIEYLVEKEGANPNVVDNFGGTPLQDAVKNGHTAAARVLRDLGGVLLLQDCGSALCNLVLGGNIDNMRLYLEHGVDPNSGDYDMRTPLHIAAAEGMLPMFKLLVEFGADMNLKDRFGTTAVDEAKANQQVVTVLTFIESVTTETPEGARVVAREKLANMLSKPGSINIKSE
eukprot:CAMPEP_0117659060 /NCGR_PEP_ID=MMETSP0804-20121206/6221_1 /TAXON_ID=1074897 /ORGANISM="Tetraselmis astigmatica, Strain CCMP880" /LENGTH=843 /DNA_ID=CAMNT_0005465673 /DNA_START=755 /DNA_END=3286 /DNA_ORIENTATION=+